MYFSTKILNYSSRKKKSTFSSFVDRNTRWTNACAGYLTRMVILPSLPHRLPIDLSNKRKTNKTLPSVCVRCSPMNFSVKEYLPSNKDCPTPLIHYIPSLLYSLVFRNSFKFVYKSQYIRISATP